MSVLSASTQKQVEDNLLQEGVLSSEKLQELKADASSSNTPLFSLLVNKGGVSDEILTRTIAKVTKVPYVKLSTGTIDADVLALLPQEIAERYMAVPLGEMQHR